MKRTRLFLFQSQAGCVFTYIEVEAVAPWGEMAVWDSIAGAVNDLDSALTRFGAAQVRGGSGLLVLHNDADFRRAPMRPMVIQGLLS